MSPVAVLQAVGDILLGRDSDKYLQDLEYGVQAITGSHCVGRQSLHTVDDGGGTGLQGKTAGNGALPVLR